MNRKSIGTRQKTQLYGPHRLPSTLIRHENITFRKRSSNRRNLKTPAFLFRADRKRFT